MQTQFETLVVVLLLVICGALVVIALILQRTFAPTIRQRLRILDDRTAFNIELAEKHGERKLARFALSEASLATQIEDLAEEREMDEDARGIARDQSRWTRFKTWISKNTETLVGKVNDVAKSALGMGGGA